MDDEKNQWPFPDLREALRINPMVSIEDYKEVQDEIIYNNGMLLVALLSADMYNVAGRCSINTISEPILTATSHFIYKVSF